METVEYSNGVNVLIMKSSVFWDITPCISFKVKQHFRGLCHLHGQDQKTNQARNQQSSACNQLHSGFLLGLFSGPEI
jgi:hypothetical protein